MLNKIIFCAFQIKLEHLKFNVLYKKTCSGPTDQIIDKHKHNTNSRS